MPSSRMLPGSLLVLACVFAIAPPALGKPAAKPKVDGFWDVPAGQLELRNEKGKVIGTLTSVADGAGLAVGDKVLTGSLDEDNLTADVRVGALVPKCGKASGNAFVVLLVTRSGKLTGGASAKAACARDLSSITLTRSKDPGSDGAKPATVGAIAPVGQYDPLGRRQVPLTDTVKALLTDGKQYMAEGDFEAARKQFEKALAKDATVGEIYNGIGATYAIRNDYETAVDWYKRGLEAAPGFGDLYYNLACAYSQQTKPALALRYLKLAATKGYAEVDILDQDHDLDPIRSDPEFVQIRSLMGPAGAPPSGTSPPATGVSGDVDGGLAPPVDAGSTGSGTAGTNQ